MPEFLDLQDPETALNQLLGSFPVNHMQSELVAVKVSLGRIVSRDVFSPEYSPGFPRSTVDGYAVKASDTYGASESMPVYLKLTGEITMGRQADINLSPGTTAIIHTGGMLPQNADAVVMFENSTTSRPGEVEILRAAAEGENVILTGEDVKPDDLIIPSGSLIRPQELGGMLAVGVKNIEVYKRPRIAVISSGDELVPPDIAPGPGQVRNINSYTIAALIQESGGIPIEYGIMPDKIDQMRSIMQKALFDCEMMIVTAGSSTSTRDLTAGIINDLGSPGILSHGINVRPGKPTIFAVCNGKPIVGLPGNPVSALVIAKLFVVPVIEKLSGRNKQRIVSQVSALLESNIPSQAGRTDYYPVVLSERGSDVFAEPVHYKSNLIFSLIRADGLACIPKDANGVPAGAKIKVILFD